MKAVATPAVSPRARWFQSLGKLAQIALYIIVWLAAEWLVKATGISIPAGVLGLMAVLLLLCTRVVNVRWIDAGAAWMLDELVLFFIPGVVAVIQYADLFKHEGVKLVLAIATGTVLVMASTALAVHLGCKLENCLRCRPESKPQGVPQALGGDAP